MLTRCYRCGKLASAERACSVCGSERHIEKGLDELPRIPLEDRKAYIATAPWIRRLKRTVACQGWMSGGRKCKKPAEWSYRRRGRTWWANQKPELIHLCWTHLSSSGLRRDPAEEERWEKFQKNSPPPWWTPERQAKIDELNRAAQEA
jgi:hypothetical protein